MVSRTIIENRDLFRNRLAPNAWFMVNKCRRKIVVGEMGIDGVGTLIEHAELTYRELTNDWVFQRMPKPTTPSPGVRQS